MTDGVPTAKDRGASILAVIFILTVIVFMGVIFVSLLTTGSDVSTKEADSIEALYVAEGGIESAIGHLVRNPPSTYWVWNDGYAAEPLGSGTANVEVMEHTNRDDNTASATIDETFELCTENAGANEARTVLVTLSWTAAVDLDLELFDETPTSIGTSTTDNPEVVRTRVAYNAACRTYTARITGNGAGNNYELRISHPDSSGFGNNSDRAIISEGTVNEARREVFSAVKRN